jgi:HK97 gp10 family phage protein
MGKAFTVKVEGLQELERQLKQFGPKVERNGLRTSAYAGAKVFMNAVKETAPVREGTLRARVRAFKRRGQAHEARYSVGVSSGPRVKRRPVNPRKRLVKYPYVGPRAYSRYLEFGTSKMAARPFMRPAFNSNTSAAIEAVKRRLAKAVAIAAKRAG